MQSLSDPRSLSALWTLALAVLIALGVIGLRFGLSEPDPWADLPLEPQLPDPGPLPEFHQIDQVDERKEQFFGYLLPVVEAQNAWLVETREFLRHQQQLLLNGQQPGAAERERLHVIGQRYRIVLSDPIELAELDELLLRADLIPPSLALAQAAAESGWGTSRFAREGNNLFGEWCFREGCGLVPQRRLAGARHEVATFDSVADAIDSYYRNLNTHPAYAPMRELRAQARDEDGGFVGTDLVPGLLQYSERRQSYLDEILLMIRANNLVELDREQLPFDIGATDESSDLAAQ